MHEILGGSEMKMVPFAISEHAMTPIPFALIFSN